MFVYVYEGCIIEGNVKENFLEFYIGELLNCLEKLKFFEMQLNYILKKVF